MSSSTDLKTYATSTTDFYALLSLSPTFSQHDLDRAWRRTALKYHPDKVGASDVTAAEKFHLAQIGYDILSDPSIKALYDNARTAREQKEKARKMFEGERKRMREELEGREGRAGLGAGMGMKRGREEEDFEREIRRLAEDGKRRRREREDALRAEMRAEEEMAQSNGLDGLGTQQVDTATETAIQTEPPAMVPELERSVKARWIPSTSLSIDKDKLVSLFSRFGIVESAFLLKTKTQRIGPSRDKKQVSTGVVVYTSVVGAHAAIEDAKKQAGEEWEIIESVRWAGNKEPDFVASISRSGSPAPSTPMRKGVGDFLNGGIPSSAAEAHGSQEEHGNRPSEPDGEGLRKVPSFASFSSAAFSTPKGSPFGKVGSPSLEEITMIRLKEAEKRRLKAEIQKADELAAKADASV